MGPLAAFLRVIGKGIAVVWRSAPVRLWAMIGAAPAISAYVVWQSWIVWRGGWPADRAQQQLTILGWALWGALAIIAVIIIALAAVKVRAAGPGGTSIEVDGGDDPPSV